MLLYETGISNSPKMDVNPSNWLDWQRDSKTFESFAAWSDRNSATLTGQGEPERLEAETVSYEFFSVLKIRPILGRDSARRTTDPERVRQPCSATRCGSGNLPAIRT